MFNLLVGLYLRNLKTWMHNQLQFRKSPYNASADLFPSPLNYFERCTSPDEKPVQVQAQKAVGNHLQRLEALPKAELRANYACPSANDTSSLWVHFKKCKKNPERVLDKKQQLLSFKKEKGGASNLLAVTFNNVRCGNVLAKFVVKDDQAFKVVEGEGFKELVQELQPMFVVPSKVTIARDVHHLYFKERAKLMEVLTTTGQRACLTSDCWTYNPEKNKVKDHAEKSKAKKISIIDVDE
ncbi:hypothetical protein POM88_030358 [Heracleum sosnowskyi]|uniref:Uncharacterized protein n=1 Tax=Heracleum sosnowskyi TaxID=360622 RepID=A0AAD8HVS3_9APIA|nr:hypothetical protein POM88_030358 [Heracleum sosnowskyi]